MPKLTFKLKIKGGVGVFPSSPILEKNCIFFVKYVFLTFQKIKSKFPRRLSFVVMTATRGNFLFISDQHTADCLLNTYLVLINLFLHPDSSLLLSYSKPQISQSNQIEYLIKQQLTVRYLEVPKRESINYVDRILRILYTFPTLNTFIT